MSIAELDAPAEPKPRRERKPARRRPHRAAELITHAAFKNLRWPLDDAMAAAISPGKVMHLRITVRFEDVEDYSQTSIPSSWITSVLEVGEPYE